MVGLFVICTRMGLLFLILVYAHIFRGLYYGSYMEPRQHLWWSGALVRGLLDRKRSEEHLPSSNESNNKKHKQTKTTKRKKQE